MKINVSILLLFLSTIGLLSAQQHEDPIALGQGNTSAGSINCWSVLHNPANIALLKTSSFASAYSNRYFIAEMAERKLVANHPLPQGAVSVYLTDFGFTLYQMQTLGMAYAMLLGNEIYGGIRLHINRLKLGEHYGKQHNVTANIGFTTNINNHFRISSALQTGENLPQNYPENRNFRKRLALHYSFSATVQMQIELDKRPNTPLQLKWGVAYQIQDRLTFRAGLQEQPQQFGFGWSYTLHKLTIHFGFALQPVLGYQPALSLSYAPSKGN